MKRFLASLFFVSLAMRGFSLEPLRYFFTEGDAKSKVWSASVPVSGYRGTSLEEANHTIDSTDVIFFDRLKGSGYTGGKLGCLYIMPDVACKEISVINSTKIQLGLYSENHSLPPTWTVNLEKDSQLIFNNDWDKDKPVLVPDASFLGEGRVSFGSKITALSDIRFGKIKGDAVISITGGLIVRQIDSRSFIENPLAGYGTVVVKNPHRPFKLAVNSNVRLELDSSIVGDWNVETNASFVTFKENFTRAWPLNAESSTFPTTSFETIFSNLKISALKVSDIYKLRARIVEDLSDGPRVTIVDAEWGEVVDGKHKVIFSLLGDNKVEVELQQDGPNIKACAENLSGARIVGLAAAISHEVSGVQSWNELPEGVDPEDLLILDDSAELTLGFPLLNPIEGSGKVFPAVETEANIKKIIPPSGWILAHYPAGNKSGSDIGANGAALWKSYCLGLDPTDSSSLPILSIVQTSYPDSLTIVDLNYKPNSLMGVNVTPKLLEAVPGGAFSEVDDDCVSRIDSGFELKLLPSSPKVRFFKLKYEFD